MKIGTKSERYDTYFQALYDEMTEQHHFTGAYRPVEGRPYYVFTSSRGIRYIAGFDRAGRVYTSLVINSGNYEKNKNFFDTLRKRESEINVKFKVPLYWARRDDIKSSVISISRDGTIDTDESKLEAFRAWHIASLLKFKAVFDPEIQTVLNPLR
ncbi:DUF4268 domain-containing protein [Candidatus Poribacteria bacterium]|nr:DUF4268 domain-containing protein [Candidatus Poribacteria bacterium]MYB01749.1 DUF4268 domain-containing protein [Candidatus Poribacteria bacterium]